MAFRYADPEQLAAAVGRANERLENEAPTVATASGSASRSSDAASGMQGPEGEFAVAANDPAARGYFNDYMNRLRFHQRETGDIPPPPNQADDLGMTPEEEEALA